MVEVGPDLSPSTRGQTPKNVVGVLHSTCEPPPIMDIDLFSPIHSDDTTVVQAGNAQSANAEDDSSVSPESAGPSVTCELCQLHRIFAGKAWIHVHMKQRRDCFTILLDDDGTAYYGRILDQATMQQHQVEPESRPRRAVTVTRHLQMYRRIIAAIRGLDSRLSLLSRFPEDIDSPPPLLEQTLEATDPIPITSLLPQPLRGQLRPFAESPGSAPSSPHPSLSLGIPAPPPKPSEAGETSRRPESGSEVPAPRSERQARGDKALIWTGRTCLQCIRDERQQQFRSFVHIHSPGLLICTSCELKSPFKRVCRGCLGSPVHGPHPNCPEGSICGAWHPTLREGASYPGHHSYRPPRDHLSIRDSERLILLRVDS